MISLSQNQMIEAVKNQMAKDQNGYKMQCVRHQGKWSLVFSVDGIPFKMGTQIKDVRLFSSVDSALKVSSTIVDSMTVMGQ